MLESGANATIGWNWEHDYWYLKVDGEIMYEYSPEEESSLADYLKYLGGLNV